MRIYQTYILILAMALPAVIFAESHPLHISQGMIQAGPPNAQVLAGYMTLENTSDKTIVITGATSPLFKQVEFHQTFTEGGMMRMRKQEQLSIPAHKKLMLKPGSYHMMLINPTRALQPGDQVPVTIKTSSKNSLSITLTVKLPDTGMQEHHHHHH